MNRTLHVPDGWELVPATGMRDISILTAPRIGSATIDFERRGFRAGAFVTTGRFVSEERTTRGGERKRYGGRGWRQTLVDDAVAWLRGVQR